MYECVRQLSIVKVSKMTETMSLSLIDSHCHIDMPEDAWKPVKEPDSAGGSARFDAGLTVRWVWGHSSSATHEC